MFSLVYAKENDLADFYIQCKGLHSGRPLQNYIPNSFAVFHSVEFNFERCFCVWKSKGYYQFLRGSVVPFISIVETRKFLNEEFLKMVDIDNKRILAVKQLNDLIHNTREKIILYKNMQHALAHEILKNR